MPGWPIGATAPGSMAQFLAETRLKEDAGTPPAASQMVKNLLADHESLIGNLRKDLDVAANAGAADVSDYLTGLLEDHEKMAWMLRSIAEG